ncbi:MAG: hypothetical protein HC921_21290 [Synechococcaceae cyanobacterium SM2_3_1]|nr:hypothetical protein [Synechococcaceae cyanobacterium SM2_3_1]
MSSSLPSPEQQPDFTSEPNSPEAFSGLALDSEQGAGSSGPVLFSYSPDPYQGRLTYHSLDHLLSLLDLDILEELEHFRTHLADLTSSLSGSVSQGHSSQPLQSSSFLGSQSAIPDTEMAHPYRSTRGAAVSPHDILKIWSWMRETSGLAGFRRWWFCFSGLLPVQGLAWGSGGWCFQESPIGLAPSILGLSVRLPLPCH